MENKYSYSTDEEHYTGSYDSREEALAAGRAEGIREDCSIWTGLAVPYTPAFESAVEAALEHLAENAEGDCGKCAEDWRPDQNADLALYLTAQLTAAITKLHPVTFWTVTDVKEHEPEEQDDEGGDES